ncbi:MAG: cyclic nucleotide-binding domain-containing protein [Pseudomonadota bacterium]
MRVANTLSRAQVQMVLNKIPFFRLFSSDERERLAGEQSSFHVAREGEYVIRQGSQERAFYILLSGAADVLDADNSRLTGLQPGDVFGEIGFLSDQVRTSHVMATTASILLRIDQALMQRLRPEMREKIKDELIQILVRRILQS